MRFDLCCLRTALPLRQPHHAALSGLLASLIVLGFPTRSFAQEGSADTHPDLPRLQSLVNDLKAKLAIPQSVVVSLVPQNSLMMSVAAPADAPGAFQLSIEASFLDVLSDDELAGAIAHELAHVWIFTHHPFLQTEQLANEIAMRVVSRDTLERVYEKVWRRGDTKGDLARVLGPQPTIGLASAGQPE